MSFSWNKHSKATSTSLTPALSTNTTAAGELFLFGGYVHGPKSSSNDLYVISTRDFSTTHMQTSGDVPGPLFGHRSVLTSTILLIWGGISNLSDQSLQVQSNDDSLYLLNLGTSNVLMSRPAPTDQGFLRSILVSREWSRIVVNGPGPGGGRHNHTMTLVGSKLFVFGGRIAKRRFNDIWAFDLNCCAFAPRFPEAILTRFFNSKIESFLGII
jgi:hypothetical protein